MPDSLTPPLSGLTVDTLSCPQAHQNTQNHTQAGNTHRHPSHVLEGLSGTRGRIHFHHEHAQILTGGFHRIPTQAWSHLMSLGHGTLLLAPQSPSPLWDHLAPPYSLS